MNPVRTWYFWERTEKQLIHKIRMSKRQRGSHPCAKCSSYPCFCVRASFRTQDLSTSWQECTYSGNALYHLHSNHISQRGSSQVFERLLNTESKSTLTAGDSKHLMALLMDNACMRSENNGGTGPGLAQCLCLQSFSKFPKARHIGCLEKTLALCRVYGKRFRDLSHQCGT